MAVLAVAGCRLSAAPPGGLAQEAGATVSPTALRIRVRSLVGPYTATIEQAADEAARRCGQEPGVRIHALEWKLGAVSQAQDALLQPDPGAALVDAWAFADQMESYFELGPGRSALGACRPIAIAAARHLQAGIRQEVARVVPSRVSDADRLIRDWTAEHPIGSPTLPRASITGALAERSTQQRLGALAALGSVVETLDDLTARMAAYRESLLKEARWTAELAAGDAASSEAANRALADLERVSRAADRLGVLAARIPSLVARERETALAALRQERIAVMADIDRQRVETLSRIEGVSRSAIDEAADRAGGLVDRAFLRGAELAIGLALLAAVAVLLVAWVLGFRIRVPRRA